MTYKNLAPILAALGIKLSRPRDDGWMYGPCPFAPFGGHKSVDNRSLKFQVKADNRKVSGYNCYVCGRTGTVTQLIDELGGLRRKNYLELRNQSVIAEADVTAALEFGEYELPPRPDPISPGQIKGIYKAAWDVPEARSYLKRRLISESTATLLGLLFSGEVGGDDNRLEHNRIMFPVKNRAGQLFGFSGRSINHQSKAKVQDMFHMKKDFNLLGLEHVSAGTKKPILLVEGLFAYASLYEVGADLYGHPLASLGAHLSKFQAEILIDLGLPVYCFYDNDESGMKGIYGYMTQAGRKVKGIKDLLQGHPVFIPPWPKNPDKLDPKTGEMISLCDPDELLADTVKMMMDASKML